MPGPVFKTGEGSGNRLLVGSIPMRSRQLHEQPANASSGFMITVRGWEQVRSLIGGCEVGRGSFLPAKRTHRYPP